MPIYHVLDPLTPTTPTTPSTPSTPFTTKGNEGREKRDRSGCCLNCRERKRKCSKQRPTTFKWRHSQFPKIDLSSAVVNVQQIHQSNLSLSLEPTSMPFIVPTVEAATLQSFPRIDRLEPLDAGTEPLGQQANETWNPDFISSDPPPIFQSHDLLWTTPVVQTDLKNVLGPTIYPSPPLAAVCTTPSSETGDDVVGEHFISCAFLATNEDVRAPESMYTHWGAASISEDCSLDQPSKWQCRNPSTMAEERKGLSPKTDGLQISYNKLQTKWEGVLASLIHSKDNILELLQDLADAEEM